MESRRQLRDASLELRRAAQGIEEGRAQPLVTTIWYVRVPLLRTKALPGLSPPSQPVNVPQKRVA